MAKKKTSRRSRFADDAALQALVRYGPEETGLKALAQQARADYGVSVRQAQTTGDLTLAAAKEAIPGVAKIYDSAGLAQARTASLVSPELAALTGPGAATLQRGGALEVAQQLGNLRASKASALEDLTTRQVAARQGQQFGVLAARQKFTQDMAKILGQSQGLRQQKGAFTASTLNALEQAALGRAVTKRGQDKTAEAAKARVRATKRGQDLSHQDRVASLNQRAAAAAKNTLPGGQKLNTAAMHGRVADQVRSLQAVIQEHKGDYKSRAELAHDLLVGVPASTLKKGTIDPNTGKPLAADIHDPGIPKAPSQLALQAALDIAYNGGVSNGTARALHQRGFSVGVLGLPNSAAARKRQKAKVRGIRQAFAGLARGV
jgi:hypothetical protein